jgi:hypothetical protein
MNWLVGILIFIFSVIAIFATGVFVLMCISSVVNPQFKVEGENVIEKNQNARLMYLIIAAIAWGLVIAL